jgi:membrane associated rhomboid family serine protease
VFPLADENERGHGPAFLTLAFIAINVFVFLALQEAGAPEGLDFTYGWAAVPAEITGGQDLVGRVQVPGGAFELSPGPDPVYLTLLSSMFMHGGWLHLGGNMLFLWIFGDNVEHRVGHVTYLVFYLVAGVAASFAQIMVDPDSLIPTLGASGAISGVLGAYLVLFPGNRVTVFVFRFLTQVPAVVAIGMWAVLQFVNGIGQIAVSEETAGGGGVAYMAHIGGFVVGVLAGFFFRSTGTPPRRRATRPAWG